MKAYGLNRVEADDLDACGCADNGRATALYNIKEHAYHSLRGGKKAAARRIHKRRARAEGREETRHWDDN